MSCSADGSKARWLIQFSRGTITYQTMDHVETILHRSQDPPHIFGAQTSVVISSGRLLKLMERTPAVADPVIDGVLLGATRLDDPGAINADITRFECSVPRRP